MAANLAGGLYAAPLGNKHKLSPFCPTATKATTLLRSTPFWACTASPPYGARLRGRFFQTTPPDLVADGLYKALAIAFMKGEKHRKVSYLLLAKSNLGAVQVEGRSVTDLTKVARKAAVAGSNMTKAAAAAVGGISQTSR